MLANDQSVMRAIYALFTLYVRTGTCFQATYDCLLTGKCGPKERSIHFPSPPGLTRWSMLRFSDGRRAPGYARIRMDCRIKPGDDEVKSETLPIPVCYPVRHARLPDCSAAGREGHAEAVLIHRSELECEFCRAAPRSPPLFP